MINPMRYNEVAAYADGRETKLTGREADVEYAARSIGAGMAETIVIGGKPLKFPTTDDEVDWLTFLTCYVAH